MRGRESPPDAFPEHQPGAVGLTMIEAVGAAFALHVLNIEPGIAAQRADHLVEDLEGLLDAGIFGGGKLRRGPAGRSRRCLRCLRENEDRNRKDEEKNRDSAHMLILALLSAVHRRMGREFGRPR